MKKNIIFSLFLAGILMLSSCEENYKMLTRINSDGSCSREVWSKADSSFMTGDTTHNPFPFDLTPEWSISWLTPSNQWNGQWPQKDWAQGKEAPEKSIGVKASRKYNSVKEMIASFNFNNSEWKNIKPQGNFEKQFRWFYTYYNFKEIYPKLPHLGPIPLDKYMTPEEQKIWFTDDIEIYKGMNGHEAYDLLDNIQRKFEPWLQRNLFEINCEAILGDVKTENPAIFNRLQQAAVKDSIFNQNRDTDYWQAKNAYQAIDKYLSTDLFTRTYRQHQQQIDSICDAKMNIINQFSIVLNYQLLMPGEITESNAPIVNRDTLVWRIDAFRFAIQDLQISARSRVLNTWAIIVSTLFLSGVIYYVYRSRK